MTVLHFKTTVQDLALKIETGSAVRLVKLILIARNVSDKF